MDDYPTAFISRCLDTKQLYNQNRKIAAMHLGGITIECLLKKVCFIYHGLSDWEQVSKRTGKIIYNPKHRLSVLISLINSLYIRASYNQQIMDALKKVQEPCGLDYILWRYQGNEPGKAEFDDWYKSYLTLLKWLLVQIKTI